MNQLVLKHLRKQFLNSTTKIKEIIRFYDNKNKNKTKKLQLNVFIFMAT